MTKPQMDTTRRVLLVLPRDLLDRLDTEAAERSTDAHKMTRSELIRRAILDILDRAKLA
jgi:metal-responsive CopG/Arc/MetJ family transcriptional regulator